MRLGLSALALVLVVIVTAWSGRVSEGRRSLEACDAAFARGDRVEAIVFARTAAEARCPWCSSPELGYARLFVIAKDAESHGEDSIAVAAWRAVRAATLGATLLDASSSQRERADAEIARLEHRIDAAAAAAGGGGPPSPAAAEDRLRVALAANTVPSSTVFILLAVGGALFFIGALRFVRVRSRDRAGASTADGIRASIGELSMAIAGGALAAAGVLLF